MRAVIQRVLKAEVIIDGDVYSSIDKGLLVFVGIGRDDNENDIDYLCEKIINLRIFEKDGKECEVSVKDIGGSILVVSQFTLYADSRKGRRPSFSDAMKPEDAIKLYDKFIERIKSYSIEIKTGVFQAMMKVNLINDGPFTILLDSKKIF